MSRECRYREDCDVGYTTKTIDTANQQQMVGGQFVSIGEEAINIQDIKVSGEPDDGGAWIKWWDPANKVYSDKVIFVSELYSGGDPIVPTTAGWGDKDWEIIEKTFAPGEGFWWGVNKKNCGLTVAGEVLQPATEYVGRKIATANQQQMVINPFPMNLDIQSITVGGEPDDGGAWIKWWDPANKVYSDKVIFVSELYSGGEAIVPTTAGWGDKDWEIIEKTFAPGEGFWWGVNKNNCTLQMPNPFYKK